MPWSNNSGGGGWKGGGGGPWGGGPQQRGPQPPDLEELLKRSQDRLRNVLPGGGRSNALVGVLIVLALVLVWAFNSLYMVQPDELGQELVFGKPKQGSRRRACISSSGRWRPSRRSPRACSASSSAPTPRAATPPTPA